MDLKVVLTCAITRFSLEPQETDSVGELRVENGQITLNETCKGKLGSNCALNVLGC